MRSRVIQVVSSVLCACLMIGVVFFVRADVKGAESSPSLYCNDRPWQRGTSNPVEKVFALYYIPASAFAQLSDSCRLLQDSKRSTFIIMNGEKWISFDLESNFATLPDRTSMYMEVYSLHKDKYVPAKAVCEIIGIKYEELTSPITGEVAIRISDGNETLTFRELLEKRNPGFFSEITSGGTESTAESSGSSSDTSKVNPPTSSEPKPVLGERVIYLTFEDSPGNYTDKILDVLAQYGYEATFFVIGDMAAENPELLSRIVAEGHSIALHTMKHDRSVLIDADAVLADIENENQLLSRIIKQRSHIWRAPEGSDLIENFDDNIRPALENEGYISWDYNVDVSPSKNAAAAASDAIKGIWDNKVPVIRFRESKNLPDTLKTVLKFISENSKVCEVRAINPAMSGDRP